MTTQQAHAWAPLAIGKWRILILVKDQSGRVAPGCYVNVNAVLRVIDIDFGTNKRFHPGSKRRRISSIEQVGEAVAELMTKGPSPLVWAAGSNAVVPIPASLAEAHGMSVVREQGGLCDVGLSDAGMLSLLRAIHEGRGCERELLGMDFAIKVNAAVAISSVQEALQQVRAPIRA